MESTQRYESRRLTRVESELYSSDRLGGGVDLLK